MQQPFIMMAISPSFDLSAKCIQYSIEFILEKYYNRSMYCVSLIEMGKDVIRLWDYKTIQTDNI
jgi:hypothetical protein